MQDSNLVWLSFYLTFSHKLANGAIQGFIHSSSSSTRMLQSLKKIDQDGIHLLVYYISNYDLDFQVFLLI